MRAVSDMVRCSPQPVKVPRGPFSTVREESGYQEVTNVPSSRLERANQAHVSAFGRASRNLDDSWEGRSRSGGEVRSVGVSMNKWLPDGWHSITARIVVEDAAAYVAFLRQAFGATGEAAEDRPCEMTIGDSIVMISTTQAREQTRAFFYLYVPDADATYNRALAAGARSVEEPWDTPYGDRRAMITDPCGNDWQLATRQK
jgi:PhnB protein